MSCHLFVCMFTNPFFHLPGSVLSLVLWLRQTLYIYIFFISFSLFYFPSSVRMSVPDIYCSVLLDFALVFDTAAFKARFNSFKIPVEHFLECIQTAANPVVTVIMEIMGFKVLRNSPRWKKHSIWRVGIWHFETLELSKVARYLQPLWPSLCMIRKRAGFGSILFTFFAMKTFQ